MGKTIAELLRAEGRREGRAKDILEGQALTLLRMLRNQFGELPPVTVATVKSCREIARLEAWMDRLLSAASLDEMGITPGK